MTWIERIDRARVNRRFLPEDWEAFLKPATCMVGEAAQMLEHIADPLTDSSASLWMKVGGDTARECLFYQREMAEALRMRTPDDDLEYLEDRLHFFEDRALALKRALE